MEEAIVFTDGSSSKSRQGGWAALILLPDRVIELTGSETDTTNNRMEMMAAIKALEELKEPHTIYLVSDSAYLLNTIKGKWYDRWFADEIFFDNQYAKQLGRPTPRPNLDLWEKIALLSDHHQIIPVKVKGHSGDTYNDICDTLAVEARVNQGAETRREFQEFPIVYGDTRS